MNITYLSETNPVVLVVDGDPLMLTGIASMLHAEGYEVHCAADGEAAMKAGHSLALDLLICDIRIGNQSGLEIFHQIQETDANRDVPAMFMVSQQIPDVVRRAHDGGVYYLRKPFDPKVMMELVDRALWMPHLVKANLDESGVEQRNAAPTTPHVVPAPSNSPAFNAMPSPHSRSRVSESQVD